jgi:hypothetical protein
MTSQPSKIDFMNCKTEKRDFNKMGKKTRILILDEIESLSNFADVIRMCQKLSICILGISNYHDETLALARSGRSDAISLVFETYTADQLVAIMNERMGGPSPIISERALLYIAKAVEKERGDAREALNALNFVLTQAVNDGVADLDIQKTQSFLALRTDRKGRMVDFPLIDQIATVSVFKGGKQWRTVFQGFLTSKHMSSDIGINEIFERLLSYGFVGGSMANPKFLLEKNQLLDGLDPIAASIL